MILPVYALSQSTKEYCIAGQVSDNQFHLFNHRLVQLIFSRGNGGKIVLSVNQDECGGVQGWAELSLIVGFGKVLVTKDEGDHVYYQVVGLNPRLRFAERAAFTYQ